MIGKSNFVSTDEACFEKKQEMLASELQNTYSYLKTICKGQIVWFGLESNNNALKYVLGNTYLITKSINDLNKTLYATINNDDAVSYTHLLALCQITQVLSLLSPIIWMP